MLIRLQSSTQPKCVKQQKGPGCDTLFNQNIVTSVCSWEKYMSCCDVENDRVEHAYVPSVRKCHLGRRCVVILYNELEI